MKRPLPFKQVKRSRLYEEVAEQIKQAIFDGILKPGDRLPSERDLCETFGVGRPTIREALRILSIMGLVEIKTGANGSTVKDLDITQYLEAVREQLAFLIRIEDETIDRLWEVRKYVEIGIAHLAAEKASPEEIKRLERIISDMKATGEDINAYFPLATSFHQELALSTKNQIFYIIWNLFQDILKKAYMPVLEEYFPEGPGKLLESNRVLLGAIKSKDPKAIDDALHFHAQQEKDLVDAARKKGPPKK